MTPPEAPKPNDQAQAIIKKVVAEFRQKEPNPSLRMMATLCAQIITRMKREGIPPSEYPLAAHIGDISPDIDEQNESPFVWLKDFLGFTSSGRAQLHQIEENIRGQLEETGIAPSRYDLEVMGLPFTRQLLAQELARYGFESSPEEIRLVDGGTAAYNLAFSAVGARVWNEHQRQPRLLAVLPTYTMATNCARDKGMQVMFADATNLPQQELTAEVLLQFSQEQPDFTPDLMYLVPTNNPMASVADPEKLQVLLEQAQKLYPEMQYCFDLAYLGLVPLEKASAMIAAINRSGVNSQSYFCYSESKRLMNPGARWGAFVAPADLQELVGAYAKRGSFSTFSRIADLAWASQLTKISQYREQHKSDPITNIRALFQQRQRLLLQYLQQINGEQPLFVDLPENPPDIPLYLWLKLNQGVNAYDVIERLKIVGVPGGVFGDPRYMRFAVGALPSGLIQARIK